MADRGTVEKILFVTVPLLASALGWALLLRFSPVKNSRDLLNRLLASFASSLTLGVVCAVLMQRHTPWLGAGVEQLATDLGLPAGLGVLWINAVAFAVTGLPGWWIMTGLTAWLERRGKNLVESVLDAAADKVAPHAKTDE
jgi:hypothetical protein